MAEQIHRLATLGLAEEEINCIHALILEGVIKPDSFQYFSDDDTLRDILEKYLSKCKIMLTFCLMIASQ